MTSSSSRDFDAIIYGASGFTGQYVVEYLTKINEQENLKWAIAGRNVQKLTKVLEEVTKITGKDVKNIPIFVADSDNPESLAEMCKKTKLVLNCAGPYRFYGEPVVKACIENGCHHIDISGEPSFLEGMQAKYHDDAQKAKVYVLGAAGFDSIPCETGIQFLREKFNGDLNSVETFLKLKSGPEGSKGNIGTWLSAIHGVANRNELRSVRSKIFPKPAPKSSHKLKSRGTLFRIAEISKWGMIFPVTDKSVVNRTQYYNYHNRKLRPVQINTYYVLPNLLHGFALMFTGLMLGILAPFKFGRYLLAKFPGFFSIGTFCETGPTRKQVEDSSFSVIMVGTGYSEKLSDPQDQHSTPPNKVMIISVDGPEVGYIATPICMVQAALVVLQEKDKLPDEGGVLTPGAALMETSLISRLSKQGLSYNIIRE